MLKPTRTIAHGPSTGSRRVAAVLFVVAASSVLVPPPAHAYLDPISGSVLLQVIVAGVLAVSLGAKRRWAQVTQFFRRRSSRSDQ